MATQQNSHRSLERALRILMSFCPNNMPLGAGELSARLDIHPSTVSRLAQVLAANGFLMQDEYTKKYTLGRAAGDLGRAVFSSLNDHLVVIAQPVLDDFCHRIGYSVALEIATEEGTFLAYQRHGSRRLQVSAILGESLPVHAASGAKAVLAFSDPALADRLMQRELERLTPNTVIDTRLLKKQLEEIRKNGVSYDLGELDVDVHTMAAPVFDHTNKPVAAVVLAFPASRSNYCTRMETVFELKETARKISLLLHHSEDNDQ